MVDGDRAGRVAVITRADVRRRSWRDFAAAGKEVDAELHTAAGLIDVVGIGEAPVGRLATFSLWESAKAVRDLRVRDAPASAGDRRDARRRLVRRGVVRSLRAVWLDGDLERPEPARRLNRATRQASGADIFVSFVPVTERTAAQIAQLVEQRIRNA